MKIIREIGDEIMLHEDAAEVENNVFYHLNRYYMRWV